MPRIDSLRPEQYERYKAYNREQYRIQKEREREPLMRKISACKAKGWGDVPEVDTISTDPTTLSTLINRETEKIEQQLRRYIIKRFHQEQKGECIVIVTSRWVRAKKHISYSAELTGYGASTMRKWLMGVIGDFGLVVVNRYEMAKKNNQVIEKQEVG